MREEKRSRFIVIGITDNTEPFFPPDILEIIGNGKVFSGGRRHHELVRALLPAGAIWIDIIVPLDTVFGEYQRLSEATIIVFASGDPLFFGFANTIRRKIPDAEVTVFPTFNSLQMLAHRLVLPYHDMRIVSLTGRPWPEFDRLLIERAGKIGILTDHVYTPAAIARRMLDYGYHNYIMYAGEHLGNSLLERVTTLTLEEAARRTFDTPNCVIVTATPSEHSAPVPGCRRTFGLPDAEFALLDGREKMITKMPIRLLTLQALDLPRRHVLWDIGFCTGSVSIEARLLFPHLHVVAFEIRPEGEELMRTNSRRFGAPGIEVHIGDFLEVCCDKLTAQRGSEAHGGGHIPDAVFIGGHGGRLKEIMAKVVTVLAPDGCIVMNSVSPQSKQLFIEACHDLSLPMAKPLRIAVNDYNPIEILTAMRPK